MSRLCEATFCYQNVSVLIRKNYFKKLGALVSVYTLAKNNLCKKHLRLVSVVSEHCDRN